jgi:hypothetical protein
VARRGLAWVAVALVIVVVSLLVLRNHQEHVTASPKRKAATSSDSQFYSDFNKLHAGLDTLGNDAAAAAGSGNYAAIYGDQASLRADVRVLRNDPVPAVITKKRDAGVLTAFEKGIVTSVDELANGLRKSDLSQIGAGTAGLQTVDNQSIQLYVAVGINHFAQ